MSREIKFRAWDGCDKYLAGSDGKIYSTDYNHTGKTKELKPYYDSDGYALIVINIGGKRIVKGVHRLVALSFIGPRPPGKQHINHKNAIRSDNRPENLEYVTAKENAIHGWRMGRKHSEDHNRKMSLRSMGARNPKAKMTAKGVLKIRQIRASGAMLKDIAPIFGISTAQVSSICTNKSWNHGI